MNAFIESYKKRNNTKMYKFNDTFINIHITPMVNRNYCLYLHKILKEKTRNKKINNKK